VAVRPDFPCVRRRSHTRPTQRASLCVLRCPGMIADIWAAAAEHYDESQLSTLLLEIGAINRVEPPERCYPHPGGGLPVLIRLP
jgi:hypothetical protein